MDLSLDKDELIEVIRKNHKLAISTLYKESNKKIYRYIYFRVYNEEDAEDVTEEVYIKLMKQLDRYDAKESLVDWLYQIARTEISNFWRKRYKVNDDFLKEVFNHQEQPGSYNLQAQEKVKELLAKLSDKYAKILDLRFIKGYSVKESAIELGISVENAKVLQHRALKKAGEEII